MRIVLMLVAAAVAVSAQSPDDREEFGKRLRGAERRTAELHVELALEARAMGLEAAAWHGFRRAAELDPKNADAQQGLGRVLREKVWVQDPQGTVPRENVQPPGHIQAALSRYRGKRRAIEHRIAANWEGLADWAEEAGLRGETGFAFRVLLREFPGHSRALSKLGYESVDGVRISPEDAARRAEMRRRVLESDGGERVSEESETERQTGLKLLRRRADGVSFEGQFTDGEMRALVRLAGRTREEFTLVFGLTRENPVTPIHGVFLRVAADRKIWLDQASGMSSLEREILGNAPLIELFEPDRFVATRGARPFDAARDAAVTMAARYAFRGLMRLEELPPWLAVGVPLWFTDRLLGSCYHIVPDGIDAPASTLAWRAELRRSAWEGIDPAIRDITRAGPGELDAAMAVKAWSLVDWLLTSRRDRLHDFLTRCRSGSSGKALRRSLGAESYEALELAWEEWLDETR
ncbi:MAG: hypothetical protein HUU15_01910 [Candidatus Brocadiae bacterium]|nr:hypothetical protein [Candidatus Brocadiia bacterium]